MFFNTGRRNPTRRMFWIGFDKGVKQHTGSFDVPENMLVVWLNEITLIYPISDSVFICTLARSVRYPLGSIVDELPATESEI